MRVCVAVLLELTEQAPPVEKPRPGRIAPSREASPSWRSTPAVICEIEGPLLCVTTETRHLDRLGQLGEFDRCCVPMGAALVGPGGSSEQI